MFFKSIHIKNLRGIKSLDIDNFGRINIFLGKNNVGKSSILESLFLLVGASNPELSIRINNFRDLAIDNLDEFSFIFNNLDFQNHITLNAIMNQGYRDLIIKPLLKDNTSRITNEIDLSNNQLESDFSSNTKNRKINGLSLQCKSSHREVNSEFESEISVKNGKLTQTRPEDYEEWLSGVFVLPYPRTWNLAKRVENLIVNKKQHLVVKVLKNIDPSIKNVSVGRNEMIYFDIGLERLIPSNVLGDGIRRVLSILTTIIDNGEGIVLIDEIDFGLHHSVQKLLWKSILDISKDMNSQIFATTHSSSALRNLKKACDENENLFSDNKSVSVYTVRKNKEGNLFAYHYDREGFELAIEQDIEIR